MTEASGPLTSQSAVQAELKTPTGQLGELSTNQTGHQS